MKFDLKLLLRFVISGLLGAIIGWLIVEPWRNEFGFFRDWMNLFGVSMGISLALALERFIVFRKFNKIPAVLKRWLPMLIGILFVSTLGIAYLFSSGTEIVENDKIVEDRVLLLDVSGSMNGRALRQLKSAVNEYLSLLEKSNSQDAIGCVTFESYAHVLSDLTNNYQSLKSTINNLSTDGGTNMLDGIVKSAQLINGSFTDNQKEMILVSDGKPNDESAIRNYIRELSGVKIFSIGVGRGYDRDLLEYISNQTGGTFYPSDDVSKLTSVFKDLGGLTRKSALPWWKRIIGWMFFGAVIGLVIALAKKSKKDEILKAYIPGGLIGGLVSSLIFLFFTSISANSTPIFRGISFGLLGFIIGLFIYFTYSLYVRNKSSNIFEEFESDSKVKR